MKFIEKARIIKPTKTYHTGIIEVNNQPETEHQSGANSKPSWMTPEMGKWLSENISKHTRGT